MFGLGAVFGILALATGIASLAFAYGAWTLQPWAWMLGVVLQGASIVLAVIAIIGGSDIASQIIGVAIAADHPVLPDAAQHQGGLRASLTRSEARSAGSGNGPRRRMSGV